MNDKLAVIFDGDDTLWKTQDVYDEAKNRFSKLMNSIGIKDKKIISDLDDLDTMRVPIKGFTIQRFEESMLIIYAQLSGKNGLNWDPYIEKTIHELILKLNQTPQLYDDTLSTLELLKNTTDLFLYTAGDRGVQNTKIRQLNIKRYFKEIFVRPNKSEEIFKKVVTRLNKPLDQIWMVGNSIRSDIIPAINIGVSGILVERGGWKYDTILNGLDRSKNFYTCTNLSEASKIILNCI